MSSLTSKFAEAETCIVWDMYECRMPKGVDPKTIYENIKSALATEGYRGEVSIKAYGDKNQIKKGNFPDGFSLKQKRNGPEIIHEMVSEMYMCGFRRRGKPINLMVIANDIPSYKNYIASLQCQGKRDINILVAQNVYPSELLTSIASSVWIWKNMSAGGNAVHPAGDNVSACSGSGSSQGVRPINFMTKQNDQK